MNLYTHEKLMELEKERLARIALPSDGNGRPRRTIFGPLATFSGRALRRVGEGLESWGAPPTPEHEHSHGRAHRGM